MIRRAAKGLLTAVLVLIPLAIVLFAEHFTQSPGGHIASVAREVWAACRDPGTQWMVFACCAIYFVTFTLLLKRGVRGQVTSSTPHPQSLSPVEAEREGVAECGVPNSLPAHQRSTLNYQLFLSPDLWLCGLLLIAGLHYAFNFHTASSSTQALLLVAGAMIGKGARLWVTWGTQEHSTSNIQHPTSSGGRSIPQPSTFNLQLLLATLLLLLAVAALWHPEGALQFQYRGLNRWSGPWDNPNIFGLLMGTGLLIGVGLFVSSFGFRVSSSPPGRGKGWVLWLWPLALLVCLACCAVGLLKSYSRGAWLGTALGLAVLAFQVLRFQVSSFVESPAFSCGSCARSRFIGVSWFNKNWRPLSVVLLSVVVLAFWQFRHTEFHPVRRAFSVGNVNDFSWRNRVAAWEGALSMMADKQLAGFGWNQPEPLYDQFYRPPKVSEGMAIQMNDYFMLGMSLGLPALICFAAYIGLSLTRSGERGTRNEWVPANLQPSTFNLQLNDVCHSAAIVLLVGLWFDGGLFNLATASLFWVLLEVGRVTPCAPPAHRAKESAGVELGSCGLSVPWLTVSLIFAFLLCGLFWAKARDPFHREWFSLAVDSSAPLRAAVVMPDRGGPFPVVVWCHGSGGKLETDGEVLRQFAAQGLAAVGIEYDQSNQSNFDAQFAAVLDEIARKPWAAGTEQTRSAERGVRNSTLETRNPKLETFSNPPTFNHQPATSNEPTPGPSQEGNTQPSTFNVQPATSNEPTPNPSQEGSQLPSTINPQLSTSIAWAGYSLGAQSELSFLMRHPERRPPVLVRLAGGMVEELKTSAERGVRSAEFESTTKHTNGTEGAITGLNGGEPATFTFQRSTSNAGKPTPDPSEEGNLKRETRNSNPATPLRVWIAHGETDDVFPAAAARDIADRLRDMGAEVQLNLFPGRGHGFGGDLPLVTRGAAEFCAEQLGGTTSVPVNVRPSCWYYWLPVGLWGCLILGRCIRKQMGARNATTSGRWLRFSAAGLALMALMLSALHLALPFCPANATPLKLARQWCVRPESRNDFDWLAQQPAIHDAKVGDCLDNLRLAELQRGQFGTALSEQEWREFVLSPGIESEDRDADWRRELWETFYPRMRRETAVQPAAALVASHLRSCVSPSRSAKEQRGIMQGWSAGETTPLQWESLYLAALRAVGIPARRGIDGGVLILDSGQWKAAPGTILDGL
jgi:dienelactone hydrolase